MQFNSLEYAYCILPDDGSEKPKHVAEQLKVIIHISFVLCFDGFNKEIYKHNRMLPLKFNFWLKYISYISEKSSPNYKHRLVHTVQGNNRCLL
jgi:hypothetical protein